MRGPGFDAAGIGRRLRSLPTGPAAINAQIRSYGRTLVARSRWLVRNNAYAAGARESFASAMIGTGISPLPLTVDEALKKTLSTAWLRWTDEADADWHTDFYGMQSTIAGEIFEAGECFVRLRTRRPQDGLSVPLQMQLLPAEMLDPSFNEDRGGGARIECGIEFDAIGRRVAYHFWQVHPGTDQSFGKMSGERTAVPASEVLHLYRMTEPGQVRGIPHTVAGVASLAMLDLYDDAELERKRTAALFAGFVKRPQIDAEDHPLGLQNLIPPDNSDPLGKGLVSSAPVLEPGAMVDLAPGEEVQFAAPADVGGNYEPFQYRALTKISRGFGTPYSEMTGDLSKSTYSSDRSGLVTFRRRIESMQHGVIVYQLCRPVWNRWLDEAVLAGALPISPSEYLSRRDELRAVDWLPPPWEWIDPQKDINAEIMAVNNFLKSRGRAIRQRGYDPVQTDQERKSDQDRALALGLPVEPIGIARTSITEKATDPQAPVIENGAVQGMEQK